MPRCVHNSGVEGEASTKTSRGLGGLNVAFLNFLLRRLHRHVECRRALQHMQDLRLSGALLGAASCPSLLHR
jgi:hypothetical protein